MGSGKGERLRARAQAGWGAVPYQAFEPLIMDHGAMKGTEHRLGVSVGP